MNKWILLALIMLTGCQSDSETKDTPPKVSPPPIINVAPVVVISENNPTEVSEHANITLSVDASDEDGEISEYSWTQTNGPTVNFVQNNSEIVFKTPELPQDRLNELVEFSIEVTDDDGENASTTLTVIIVNEIALLSGFPNEITFEQNQNILLNGHWATDIFQAQWEQLSGEPRTFSILANGGLKLSKSSLQDNFAFKLSLIDNNGYEFQQQIVFNHKSASALQIITEPIVNFSQGLQAKLTASSTEEDTNFIWSVLEGPEQLLNKTLEGKKVELLLPVLEASYSIKFHLFAKSASGEMANSYVYLWANKTGEWQSNVLTRFNKVGPKDIAFKASTKKNISPYNDKETLTVNSSSGSYVFHQGLEFPAPINFNSADIDNNGAVDAVINTNIYTWADIAPTIIWDDGEETILPEINCEWHNCYHNLVLGDLNSDGLIDIRIDTNHIFDCEGDCIFAQTTTIGLNSGTRHFNFNTLNSNTDFLGSYTTYTQPDGNVAIISTSDTSEAIEVFSLANDTFKKLGTLDKHGKIHIAYQSSSSTPHIYLLNKTVWLYTYDDQGELQTTGQVVAENIPDDAFFEDINTDGFVDILFQDASNNIQYKQGLDLGWLPEIELISNIKSKLLGITAFNNDQLPDLLMEYAYGDQPSIFNIYQQIPSHGNSLSFTQFNYLQNGITSSENRFPISQAPISNSLIIPDVSLVMLKNEENEYAKSLISCEGIVSDIHYVDINGDGLIDMHGKNLDGAPHLCYQNDNLAFSGETLVEQNAVNSKSNKPVIASRDDGPLFIDLNNDGLLDMFRIGWSSVVTTLSNSTGGELSQTITQLGLLETGEPPIAQLMDINLDGLLDFFSWRSSYYYNQSTQTNSFNLFEQTNNETFSLERTVELDYAANISNVGGDSSPDIISNGTLCYDFLTEQELCTELPTFGYAYQVLDFNGDGINDLITRLSETNILIQDAQTNWQSELVKWTEERFSIEQIVDYNFDGFDDVLISKGSQHSAILSSSGLIEIPGTIAAYKQRFIDIDTDGDLDFIQMSYTGGVSLYRYENGIFEDAETIMKGDDFKNSNLVDLDDKHFIDVDFDGDLDLVVSADPLVVFYNPMINK